MRIIIGIIFLFSFGTCFSQVTVTTSLGDLVVTCKSDTLDELIFSKVNFRPITKISDTISAESEKKRVDRDKVTVRFYVSQDGIPTRSEIIRPGKLESFNSFISEFCTAAVDECKAKQLSAFCPSKNSGWVIVPFVLVFQ